MPKVLYTVGEFKKFLAALPADMSALSALRAFLLAKASHMSITPRVKSVSVRKRK